MFDLNTTINAVSIVTIGGNAPNDSITSTAPLPVYTMDQIANYLTTGYWNSIGFSPSAFDVSTGGTLTYNINSVDADAKFFIEAALEAWSNVSGINFVQTTSGGADLVFDDSDTSGAYSTSYTSGGNILSSTINIPAWWYSGDEGELDSYSFQTFIHEIGHALGLGHAGNYNGSAGYRDDTTQSGDNHYLNDSWQATVMSYFDQSENTFIDDTKAYVMTPMLADILAMHDLYGTPTDQRTGDTVYGYNSTAGGYLDDLMTLTYPIAMTIYDNGGTDTLDLSGATADQVISLVAGVASDVGGATGNLFIATGVTIENATGGSGADTITGNDVGNTLLGGGGADTLSGGNGADILIGGSGNDVLDGGTSTDTLIGGAGFDTLDGGENSDVMIVDGGDTVTDTGTVGYDKAQINDAGGVTLDLTGWSGVERINGHTGDDVMDASSFTTAVVLNGAGGADTLTGGSGVDVLLGGTENDTLTGGGGNDWLLGGTGNDTMDGGEGSDVMFVGESGDVVMDTGTGGYDKAIIYEAAGVSISVGSWVGVERIVGYLGDDTIDATGASDALTITGGAGDDTLIGGSGADALMGGADNDEISGGAGNDSLLGASGSDTLNGGADNDQLTGGSGADMFVFDASWGDDEVTDFEDGSDLIDLSSLAGVSSTADLIITQSGTDTVITLVGGGADSITLTDITATDITGVDFLFV